MNTAVVGDCVRGLSVAEDGLFIGLGSATGPGASRLRSAATSRGDFAFLDVCVVSPASMVMLRERPLVSSGSLRARFAREAGTIDLARMIAAVIGDTDPS